jgi:hypothetical protein
LTNNGAQLGGFIMFRHVMQVFFNIEQFCQRKLKDIKNKKLRKNLDIVEKPLMS